MENISEIIRARITLEQELKEKEKEFNKWKNNICAQISSLKDKEKLIERGFDTEKIEKAKSLVRIYGNINANIHGETIAELAIKDILINNTEKLKTEYFGNKTYAGFYQRADFEYGKTPTYGTIKDYIGLKQPDRILKDDEKEAIVYYIKVYPQL